MNTKIMSSMLQDEPDIQSIRAFIKSLSCESTIVDLKETMLLPSVRATTRLWYKESKLIGFACVDDYNNLHFEINALPSRDTISSV